MSTESKKYYLIEWLSDRQLTVTDGWNIEAIRHQESKERECYMRVIREATLEDKLKYGIDEEYPYEPKRLFVDMDGTLAIWRSAAYMEQLLEEGYFRSLPTQNNVVEAVRIIIKTRPDIVVRSLSAYLTESNYALKEKNAWLDEIIPEIDSEHRVFCPCNNRKSTIVRKKTGYFQETDFLLDDYSINLHQWVEDDGKGIKLMNGINGTRGTWTGPSVDKTSEPEVIAKQILDYIDANS